MLHEVGADFVYVLDPDRPEGRTWDNSGLTEDVATGSAAGPTAAYLSVTVSALPRSPSRCIRAASWVDPAAWTCASTQTGSLRVGGLVAPFSRGTIETAAVQQG